MPNLNEKQKKETTAGLTEKLTAVARLVLIIPTICTVSGKTLYVQRARRLDQISSKKQREMFTKKNARMCEPCAPKRRRNGRIIMNVGKIAV